MKKISLQNLRITGYSLLFFLFVLIAGITLYQAGSLEQRVRTLTHKIANQLRFAYQIETHILGMRTSVEKFVYLNKEEDNRQAEQKIAEVQSILYDARNGIHDPHIQRTLNRIEHLSEQYIGQYRNLVIRYRSLNDNKQNLYKLGDGITRALSHDIPDRPERRNILNGFLAARLMVQKYLTGPDRRYEIEAYTLLDEIIGKLTGSPAAGYKEILYDVEDYRDHFEGIASVSRKMMEEAHTLILPLSPKIVQLAKNIYADGWQEMGQAHRAVESDVASTQVVVLVSLGFAAILNMIIAITSMAHYRLQREKALTEAAAQARNQFFANVSHEIRTPLNAIIGMSDLTLKTRLDPRQTEYQKVIRSASRTLLGLINDILDFSKIEARKLVIEAIPFSVREMIADIAAMFRMDIEGKPVELKIDIDPGIPEWLIGDPLRIQQILINLVSNAMKFTSQGSIRIRVFPQSRKRDAIDTVFTVQDTGIGVAPDKLSKIFEVFTQADGSTTRRFGGTGLGLAICKEITRLMGGDIWVDSRPGRGSTFSFNVPLAEAAGALPNGQMLPDRFKGFSALVVDAHATERKTMRQHLRSFGFRVSVADTATSGRNLLQNAFPEKPPDLLVLDPALPDRDGIGFLETLFQQQPATPRAVLITGKHQRRTDRVRAEKLGVHQFLSKPVTSESLLDTLERLLAPPGIQPDSRSDADGLRAPFSGCRILVVDDNRINRVIAAEMLESAGYRVAHAENGQQAVRKAETQDFSAILMDVQMPEMDGLEATRILRRQPRFRSTPIIAMTAGVLGEDREQCKTAGMDDFLPKPMDEKQLLACLSRRLKKNEPPAAPQQQAPDTDVMPEQPVDQPSDYLPDLDIGAGLKSLNNRDALFRELLQEFKAEYADAPDTLAAFLNRHDFQGAAGYLHKIKGISGNIGAVVLHREAARLESVLEQALPGKKPDIETFQAAVRSLFQTIDRFDRIHQTGGPTPPKPEAALPELKTDCEQLAELLQEHNYRALKQFDSIHARLQPKLPEEDLKTLKQAVFRFDFRQASQILSGIIRHIDPG